LLLIADIDKKHEGGPQVEASLRIEREASVTILFGPSGAGKTTVLRCLAGLERLTAGKIIFKDQTWADTKTHVHLAPQKRPAGFLFQDYALFPHLRARDNIAYGIRRLQQIEQRERIGKTAAMLQIEHTLDRWPRELSGGEQQRVALARVLIRQPQLLLLDEPLSALDAATRDRVRSELAQLLRKFNTPAIVVTHDWVDALTLGDEMVVMSGGRILQSGPPHAVFTQPQHREVAAAVGVETVVAGRLRRRESGVAILQVGTAEVAAADSGTDHQSFFVCIRGEDVTLETGQPSHSSARNHLRGVVTGLVPAGVLTKVVVDAGFALTALVTRQAVSDLGLSNGLEVYAVFKASAVHLIPQP
jgi:molybdate transport system ATP-binding protein